MLTLTRIVRAIEALFGKTGHALNRHSDLLDFGKLEVVQLFVNAFLPQ